MTPVALTPEQQREFDRETRLINSLSNQLCDMLQGYNLTLCLTYSGTAGTNSVMITRKGVKQKFKDYALSVKAISMIVQGWHTLKKTFQKDGEDLLSNDEIDDMNVRDVIQQLNAECERMGLETSTSVH